MESKRFKFLSYLAVIVALAALAMLILRITGSLQLNNVQIGQPAGLATQETSENLAQALTPEQMDLQRKYESKLTQTCYKEKDCVSSIDNPKFVAAKRAKSFMKDDDLVIGVDFPNAEKEDDYVKAYPLKIMSWHEVVNDFVNETPLAVTYSPLTNAVRIFVRMDGGKAMGFGVSGELLDGNMIMYDRDGQSLWNQFDGTAIAGPQTGRKLEMDRAVIMRFQDWVKKYPSTLVLSTDTGFGFDYEKFPYGSYGTDDEIFFPLDHSDNRLPLKTAVYGVISDGKPVAYLSFDDIPAGLKTDALYSYWFAWAAFYPDTQIYKPE